MNLALIDWFLIPLRPMNWRAWSNPWDTFPLVLYIEPLRFLVDYFIAKLIGDVNFVLSLSKLKTRTASYI